MKVLITGANGFLGYYLCDVLLKQNIDVIATGKGECRLPFVSNENFYYQSLDFTKNDEALEAVKKYSPDLIIHAGAMCKPDECEENKEAAWLVNVTGTKNMLAAAKESNSFFVFVSTDFVFDGNKGFYAENDKPNAVNYYGQTKYEAEKIVQQYDNWAIVRTVLVYGKPFTGRSNILTIVKDKLEKKETYHVVNDQIRTPTYVNDLAKGIAEIVIKKKNGIWHLSGADVLTPYEMACATADYLNLDKSLLIPVDASTFKQPAIRPPKTGFNIDKAKTELGFAPIRFDEGLKFTFS